MFSPRRLPFYEALGPMTKSMEGNNGACEAASVRINKRLDVTFPGDKNDNNEYSDESESST